MKILELILDTLLRNQYYIFFAASIFVITYLLADYNYNRSSKLKDKLKNELND